MALLIDETNFHLYLKQSTQSRAGVPDGNIYFDKVNNIIELIGVDELATFDHTSMGGGAADANQLANFEGITLRGLYNFENQERVVDESLRQFLRGSKGTYRFAGAFDFINGVKLDDTVLGDGSTDRNKVRSSGWIEFADTQDGKTDVDRIFHGVSSLVDIQATTIPQYALVADQLEATLQAATWGTFQRQGDINEAVQVYGSTSFGDTGAGDFDSTTLALVVRVRSWGYNPGETTSVATGIAEFSGFSAGYGVGETFNPANVYTLADVFGGAQISPWTGMTLVHAPSVVTAATQINVVATAGTFTRLAGSFLDDGYVVGQSITFANFVNGGNNVTKVIAGVTALVITVTDNTGLVDETGSGDETIAGGTVAQTGFNEADGTFSWVLRNSLGATVQECAAYLDALTLQSIDIDASAGSYIGEKGRVWYARNADGLVVTNSNESEGLFIDGLSIAEKQNAIMTDNAAATKTYPFFPDVQITVGAPAVADADAWYHAYYLDGAATADFDTATAVTVSDSSSNPVKGNVQTDEVGGKISFAYAYDTNTEAGLSAGVDKDIVVLVEGDGVAAQAIAYATIKRDAVVPITCSPPADNNA
jgi:hypothetical protein